MKYFRVLTLALAMVGCSGADLQREYRPHSGVVLSMEVVDVDRIDGKGGSRSGFYVGMSTGGYRSTGMGMSFPLGDQDERRPLVRYEVDLVDDGPTVVYHNRQQYQIGDCVLVRIHPNAERYPPRIDGIVDDCED